MLIRIDHSSNRPVYQQVIDQVKRDIASGRLVKGQKLLTVRQLAAMLVINPNTIAKAYRQLEQEGIVTTRPGAGAFVAQLDSQLSDAVRRRVICEQIERLVVDAVHIQIRPRRLAQWLAEAIEKFKSGFEKGLENE